MGTLSSIGTQAVVRLVWGVLRLILLPELTVVGAEGLFIQSMIFWGESSGAILAGGKTGLNL